MNEETFLSQAASPSQKEFDNLVSMMDPFLTFSKLINTLYLLKSLMLEEGHYEKGLAFGKWIREIENAAYSEEPEMKAKIIEDVKLFIAPFSR